MRLLTNAPKDIEKAIRDTWDQPLLLEGLPTAELPAAADWPHGVVFDITTGTIKVSDGTSWDTVGTDSLGPDGDKGDVTVGGGGTTLTIDAKAVTHAKMQDIATARLVGRVSPGTGVREELTAANVNTMLGGPFLPLTGGTLSAAGTNNILNVNRSDGGAPIVTIQRSGVTELYVQAGGDGAGYINQLGSSGQMQFQIASANKLTVHGSGINVAGTLTATGKGTFDTNTQIGGLSGTDHRGYIKLTEGATAGQVPVINFRPTAWASDAGIGAGLTDAFGITGNNLFFHIPLGKAFSWHINAAADNSGAWVHVMKLSVSGLSLAGTFSPSSWINFGAANVGPPTAYPARSVGTKTILYDGSSVSLGDYALGIESSYLWSRVPTLSDGFKWYGNTTLAATLSGEGNFWAQKSVQALGAAGGNDVGFVNSRTGRVGLNLYNGGAVAEWIVYQAAPGVSNNFHIAKGVSGVFTNFYSLNPAGSMNFGSPPGQYFQVDDTATQLLVVAGPAGSGGVQIYSNTTASAANIFSGGTLSLLLRSTSSLRYKRDVAPIPVDAAYKLREIAPIQFRSTSRFDDPDAVFYGFVAEDVARAGLTPLVAYAYQEDQLENVLVPLDEAAPDGSLKPETRPKEGEQKRPDGVQYERVVVLQQILINDLYERLAALEKTLTTRSS